MSIFKDYRALLIGGAILAVCDRLYRRTVKRRRTKEETIWKYSAQLERARQAGLSERDLNDIITNLQNR